MTVVMTCDKEENETNLLTLEMFCLKIKDYLDFKEWL